MSFSHNLATVTDNLSGFDPVAGEIDGTVIGKDYIMWQIFDGLRTFDTRVKLITGSSPTPTFLQPLVGTYVSAPTKDTVTTTATIRFYMSDDPGLLQTPANAVVYEWIRANSTSYNQIFWTRSKFMIDGGTFYEPTNSWCYEAATSTNVVYQAYLIAISASTITVMNYAPKIVFWKNGNGIFYFAISKVDSSCRGFGGFIYKDWGGYRHNVGEITEGIDINAVIGFNGEHVAHFMEGFTETTISAYNALSDNMAVLVSGGVMPSGLFTFDSVNNLIGSKLWLGHTNLSQFVIIQNAALEGVLIAHSSAATPVAGAIYVYNSKNYIHGFTFSNGRKTYRILFQLETDES